MNTLNSCVEACVPKLRSKENRKNIYVTRHALKVKDKKNKLWRIQKETGDIIDKGRFSRCASDLRKLTRKLQENHECGIAANAKKHPKAFWRYVNSRLKSRSKIEDLRNDLGSLESDDVEKSQLLNKYFASVFTVENTAVLPDFETRYNGPHIERIMFTPHMVEDKLKKLKTDSSPGPDLLHPRVLAETASTIHDAASCLFQKSLDTGTLPQAWKLGNIVPIFKKGDKQEAGNYRPVSLTSVLCKTMESLIRDALLSHFTMNNLLSNNQHGFRPKRSCDTQLLEVLEEWTQSLEHKVPIDSVYLDFRKAFDAVPHERLLKKLEGYGVHGQLLQWIRSFLTGRQQRVMVGSSVSEWVPVTSGVPQGSVLGPLLFLAFINDLPDVVQSRMKIFADDTKLYRCIDSQNAQGSLQNDIRAVCEWSDRWQLPFNSGKCAVLHLGNRNASHVYALKDDPVRASAEERDLGIVVDSNLKFKQQARTAVAKANRILAVIRRSFVNINLHTLPGLYKTLVRPILEYANSVWGPWNREDQKLIERVQRRATRMVPTLRHREYVERLQALHLPSLYYRRRRGDMIRVYQLFNGGVDQDFQQFFTLDHNTRTRGHKWKILKPLATSRVRRNAFAIRVVSDWNGLPSSVVEASSVNHFKNKLDTHWAHLRHFVPHED